jgi:3-methyl-2-oxobutanoate hydroxymethyltransferase
VKLEGGRKRLGAVQAILDAEIPVMGHIGLTPQSVHALGGFRVQGKELEAARAIVDDAIALADAGCFAIVLECVPDAVARLVTDSVDVPTIGIGAGRHCDGQVLVFHDLLGIEERIKPKFVRRYAELGADATEAVARFAADVRAGTFPSSDETYHAADLLPDELRVDGPKRVAGKARAGSEAQEPAPA